MRTRYLLLLFIFSFIVLPFHTDVSANTFSETKREELLERYNFLRSRLDYLRWYVEKFKLQKEINAVSFLVIDVDKSTLLMEQKSNHSHPIASITKLMTAVVATENIDPDQKITLSQDMFLVNAWQRPSPAIYPGVTLAVKDLIKATLIQSTNDAAQCLASVVTEAEFIKMMNEKAREIGMRNTFFYDAHGLSSLNRSSAPDIAKLIVYVSKFHPEILEITKDENFQLPGKCPQHDWLCTFKNLNTFHGIASFMGGKTGYTTAAGNTFAGIFEFNESPYVIVLLNTPSRTLDTQKIANWLSRKP